MNLTIYFDTREISRSYCAAVGIPQRRVQDAGKNAPKGKRWFI